MTNKKFMDMMNGNEKSRKVMEVFERKAIEQNLTGEAYAEARKTAVAMAMIFNKEAREQMAEEVYEYLNA